MLLSPELNRLSSKMNPKLTYSGRKMERIYIGVSPSPSPAFWSFCTRGLSQVRIQLMVVLRKLNNQVPWISLSFPPLVTGTSCREARDPVDITRAYVTKPLRAVQKPGLFTESSDTRMVQRKGSLR